MTTKRKNKTDNNEAKNVASKQAPELSPAALKDQIHGVFDKAREKVQEYARSIEEKIATK